MYGKWPESAALQDAAAREVAKQLRETALSGDDAGQSMDIMAVKRIFGTRSWRRWRWWTATPLLSHRDVVVEGDDGRGTGAAS